eukprot:3612115-Prymnesium_polylepis.1
MRDVHWYWSSPLREVPSDSSTLISLKPIRLSVTWIVPLIDDSSYVTSTPFVNRGSWSKLKRSIVDVPNGVDIVSLLIGRSTVSVDTPKP